MSLEDGVRLVSERDRLMNEASEFNPGGMIALIGVDPKEVEEVIQDQNGVVVAANFNTPRQTVISGEQDAMETVVAKVGGKGRQLKVAGGFPLAAYGGSRLRDGANAGGDGVRGAQPADGVGDRWIGARDGPTTFGTQCSARCSHRYDGWRLSVAS